MISDVPLRGNLGEVPCIIQSGAVDQEWGVGGCSWQRVITESLWWGFVWEDPDLNVLRLGPCRVLVQLLSWNDILLPFLRVWRQIRVSLLYSRRRVLHFDHSLHLWYSHWLRHDETTLMERFSLRLPIYDLWVKFVRLWKWSCLGSRSRLTWNGALWFLSGTKRVSAEHRHGWRLFTATWFVGRGGSCSDRGVRSVALQLDTKTILMPFGIPNIALIQIHTVCPQLLGTSGCQNLKSVVILLQLLPFGGPNEETRRCRLFTVWFLACRRWKCTEWANYVDGRGIWNKPLLSLTSCVFHTLLNLSAAFGAVRATA